MFERLFEERKLVNYSIYRVEGRVEYLVEDLKLVESGFFVGEKLDCDPISWVTLGKV